MGWLHRGLTGPWKQAGTGRSQVSIGGWSELFYPGATEAGVPINHETVRSLPVVGRCLQVRASLLAQLDVTLHMRSGLTTTLEKSVGPMPNPQQTWQEFIEFMANDRLLYGEAFAVATKDSVGRVQQMWPLPRNQCQPSLTVARTGNGMIQDMRWELHWRDERQRQVVLGEDMIHWRGDTWDGEQCVSLVTLYRETFATMLATERFSARQMGRAVMKDGYVKVPGSLTKEQAKKVAQRFQESATGISNSGGVMVLDESSDYVPLAVSAKDAEFAHNRRWQVAQAAQIFQVPPGLIGGVSASGQPLPVTVNDWQVFVRTALEPDARRFGDALVRVIPSLRSVDLHVDRLVQLADARLLASASQMWVKAGVMSRNEIRESMGLDPIEDERADDPLHGMDGMGGEGAREPGVNEGNDYGVDGSVAPDGGEPMLDPEEVENRENTYV